MAMKTSTVQKIISLDGIRIRIENPDLDGDGKTGDIETIQQVYNNDTTAIVQPTELGESLKELNDDQIGSNRMSNIDMRARLHHVELTYVLIMDALVSLGVCPNKCLSFTRQKKRLSVSLDGKGRGEIVDIVAGKREMDKNTGMGSFGNGMKNFFGFGNNDGSDKK